MPMKSFLFPVLLFVLVAGGCAHSPGPADSPTLPVASATGQGMVYANAEKIPPQSPEPSVKSETKNEEDYWEGDDFGPGSEGEKPEIADPLEPFNRAMYHFNDKFYFWVLKPVAQGYGKVVPETARIGVGNFFSNITFPVRFINALLQANFAGAATEFGRFAINTVWGIGGLLDPASSKEIHLSKQDEDFGQTLGVYGVGQGFYINWPILGPSSPRDTVGLVGDLLLQPFTYLNPWELWLGIRAYEKVNQTSLSIGDYESLKEAAIDPYVAFRDAYVQYRLKKVQDRGRQPGSPVQESPGSGPGNPVLLKK